MAMKNGATPSSFNLVIRCVLIATLLVFTYLVGSAHAGNRRSFDMGFTPWPWAASPDALRTTYEFINANSDIISHHIEEGVPWAEALADKPFHPKMIESWKNRRRMTSPSLKVFLSISPINQQRNGLADYRGYDYQMPIPTYFKGKRFNDADIKKAYLNYARRAVMFFEPDYLAIAVEVNELWDNEPDVWNDFIDLYKYTYQELKNDYPYLPIFFTVSLHNITNAERGSSEKTWSIIKKLWEFSDIAAISFYPFLQHPFDLRDPIGALDEVRKHTDKPIAISETGYPGKPILVKSLRTLPATPEIQNNIYYALLSKAYKNKYKFVILWAYRDYDILWESMKSRLPEWGVLWRDVGLQNGLGNDRPSRSTWELFRTIPRR